MSTCSQPGEKQQGFSGLAYLVVLVLHPLAKQAPEAPASKVGD